MRTFWKQKRKSALGILLSGLLLGSSLGGVVGCATSSGVGERYEFRSTAQSRAIEAWMEGQAGAVAASLEEVRSGEEAFLLGEHLYWEGDLEGAFEVYTSMLASYPGHGLNRYGVMRLYQLRFDVIDFAGRTEEALGTVRFDEEATLTRYALARLAHFVARDLWERSEVEEPFEFAHGGALHLFRATPRMSPWRLLDFDEVMGPEMSAGLSERYKSPGAATAVAANWEATSVVSIERPGERLNLGTSGIYYLEAYLHVEGNEREAITVGGQFPGATKLWIGDQEVLDRREEGYETGRVFREVELGPGSHRVLVKMAYQAGARDWFELFFVPRTGEVFGEAGLRGGLEAEAGPGRVRLVGEQREGEELEPVQLENENLERVKGATLYGAALSAYASGDAESFERVWAEMMERYPDFAVGHLLAGDQIRTRWDVPRELRDAAAMSSLRQAQALSPGNLEVMVRLEQWVRQQGNDREHRELMEASRMAALEVGVGSQRGVRQLRPLINWARHLERKGWTEEAEQAWRHVLSLDGSNCLAGAQLLGLYRQRLFFPAPEEVLEGWEQCPSVVETWLGAHPERLEQARDFARREALRFPYDPDRQRSYGEALRAVGEIEEAFRVVESGVGRMPGAWTLWDLWSELALLQGEEELAQEVLRRAGQLNGRTEGLDWRRARLEDRIPLVSQMHEGYQAAMAEVRRVGGAEDLESLQDQEELEELEGRAEAIALDDAYFVLDFRGTEYLEDGSSWTLTHQVIRTMTRGAIDRYAEMSLPSNARLLLARTIKENGEVRVPEEVPGKDTLSMPGLAEGDMVEVAYLQFFRPREIRSHYEGPSFFFRRSNISSRHSELLVVNAEDLRFEAENGAPEPERLEIEGREALRFVARDVRHPRSEGRSVGSLEYLPWVRPYRIGVEMHVLDAERRYSTNTLRESARMSLPLKRQLQEWLGRKVEAASEQGAAVIGDEELQGLYYAVNGHFTSPRPGALQIDASHGVQLRRGSPIVVLHTLLNYLGVENQVYLGRSDERPPLRLAVSEINRFDGTLIRVVMPESGEVFWLEMERPDGMFGAVEPARVGEAAICISCEEYQEEEVRVSEGLRPRRHVEIRAELQKSGDLEGEMKYRFEGVRAVRVRSALRGRPDGEDRRQYLERVLTAELEGAELVDFEIRGEEARGEPLEMSLYFRRAGFARQSQGALIIDRGIFEEAMERIYAPMATRNLPLFVGYEREQSYSLSLKLPEGAQPELRARDVELKGEFGRFERASWLEEGSLRIETNIDLRRQRVMPDQYPGFRRWASAVEESAWVELRL